MLINEVITPVYKKALMEGGHGVAGVGAIHISEIEPTLKKLGQSLNLDLMSNALGSVGKKEYSGDIDVALNIAPEEKEEFIEKLKTNPNVKEVQLSSVIMTKVKIENYDPAKDGRQPRTGYVQVDFMPGDPDWLKTYYHSPREEESKYKGAHRTILIAIIAAVYQQNNSPETTEDGRPLKSERWMFSPRDGLVRIIRTPVPKAKGDGYTKKNNNEIIGGPYKTADEIAKQLNLGGAEALNSFESLMAAVRSNYTPDDVEKVIDAARHNKELAGHGTPEELQ